MALKGEIIKKRECCFVEWKIKDIFSSSPHVDECWYSPSFHLSDALWCLNLYPNGRTFNNSTGWISFFLEKKESETEIHEVFFMLGLKSSNGTNFNTRTYTPVFKSHEMYGWSKFYELPKLRNEKDILFPDGEVILFCQAHLIGGENGVDAETQTDSRGTFWRLTENFKDLFLTEADADVTVKVKDKEYRAHSQILSARSPVLAAMFRHDTKEKNTGVVEIPEYDPDAFREFLIFLYSGQTEKLTCDNVIDLYSAADKYDMEDLKTRCSEFMKENISVDSLCSFLSLAITHDDNDLIAFSTNFFLKNVKKIVATTKWMPFTQKYPLQATELFIKAADKFIPD